MREKAVVETKIRHLRFNDPLRIESGTPSWEVLSRMRLEKQSCVLVCSGKRCIGIFTERDFLNKVLGKTADLSLPVDDFMSRDPRTLTVENTVGEAIGMMHERGFRNIPLVDNAGVCIGLLQVRNIIDFMAEVYPEEVLNAPTSQSFKDKDGA